MRPPHTQESVNHLQNNNSLPAFFTQQHSLTKRTLCCFGQAPAEIPEGCMVSLRLTPSSPQST